MAGESGRRRGWEVHYWLRRASRLSASETDTFSPAATSTEIKGRPRFPEAFNKIYYLHNLTSLLPLAKITLVNGGGGGGKKQKINKNNIVWPTSEFFFSSSTYFSSEVSCSWSRLAAVGYSYLKRGREERCNIVYYFTKVYTYIIIVIIKRLY